MQGQIATSSPPAEVQGEFKHGGAALARSRALGTQELSPQIYDFQRV